MSHTCPTHKISLVDNQCLACVTGAKAVKLRPGYYQGLTKVSKKRNKPKAYHTMANLLSQKRKEKEIKHLEKIAKRMLTQINFRAKKKNLEFDLTKEWLLDKLQKGNCEISETSFKLENYTKYKINPYTPSVDRIDSNKGYTKDNCQLVCHFVNVMKNQFSNQEFKEFCFRISDNIRKQQIWGKF